MRTDDAGVRFEAVERSFGSVRALRGVTFDVPSGALAVLVGPSGCGKTTALRVVAGFEPPDAGRVLVGGDDVTRVPPERRRAAMVFQHYALFPNLTVAGNVAYGPRVRGLTAAQQEAYVRETLALVGLDGLGARRPHELSGGQQQRVALARALAAEPRILLLDEPLSNVDPAQRRETRERLRALHDAKGVTTLWVTHDREEALAVADRVVVLRDGVVAQEGAPRDVCARPASAFVAEFLLDAVTFPPAAAASLLGIDTAAPVSVRPDRIGLERADGGPLQVVSVSYGPARTDVAAEGRIAGADAPFRLRAHLDTDAVPPDFGPGVAVRAIVRPADVLRFGP
jgi:putative spermidine/putrescine transport system ATP-binding protein